jgi:hypothetical protein
MSQLFQCPECGLHYSDEQLAKECEAFCREHQACNLEIIRQSVESSEGVTSEI